GKTTTFQILAGVMEASSGTAEVFGQPARDMRSHTGYLTQSFSLYPDLTVRENLRYIGDLRQVPHDEIDRRGLHYLRLFDLDRFIDRLAHLAPAGLTILVATPYLDEAERCNRVALIYGGAIQQIGSPAELRNSL